MSEGEKHNGAVKHANPEVNGLKPSSTIQLLYCTGIEMKGSLM